MFAVLFVSYRPLPVLGSAATRSRTFVRSFEWFAGLAGTPEKKKPPDAMSGGCEN